jgi:hypothetical protein
LDHSGDWFFRNEEVQQYVPSLVSKYAFESDTIEKGEIRRSGLSFLKDRFSPGSLLFLAQDG